MKEPRTITAVAFQRNYGQIQTDVSVGKQHIVVAPHGRPVMVLVPIDDYAALCRAHRRSGHGKAKPRRQRADAGVKPPRSE